MKRATLIQKKGVIKMGKKRRVLKNPKFAKLRTHPKYVRLAGTNNRQDEVQESAVETPTEVVQEPVLEVRSTKIERPKPAPKKKTTLRAKETTKTTKKKLAKTKKITREIK